MIQADFVGNKKLSLNSLYKILLTLVYANSNSKAFFIKINDLHNPNYQLIQDNLAILNKFGIDTKNHFYQSQFKNIYQSFLKKLITTKKAYLCNCKNLNCQCQKKNLQKEDFKKDSKIKIKLKAPLDAIIINKQKVFLKDTTIFENNNFTPIFTNAIDDLIAKNSFFIKESKELSQVTLTLYLVKIFAIEKNLQYLFFDSFEKEIIIEELLKNGFLPDAIINYLFTKEKEFFYLKDITFDTNSFPLTKRQFNLKKLEEFNKLHLQNIDSKKLSFIVGFADSDIGELLKLYLNENISINKLQKIFQTIFAPKKCSSKQKKLALTIQNAPYFKDYNEFLNYLKTQNSSFDKKDLYYLITGFHEGPQLEKIYPFIKSYLLEVVKCQ